MYRLEGAPSGTVAVTKKTWQQVCRVSRAGCRAVGARQSPRRWASGVTKWGAPTARPAGSARESGAETAAAPSVKKKKCTGFPFLCVPSVLLKIEDPYQYLSILRRFPLSPQSLQNLPNVLPQRPSLFALNQFLVYLPDSLIYLRLL